MNLLDHDFFVFRSSEDDSLCIVYQRKKRRLRPDCHR
ncbi:MAG: sigma 54 modulation/S30EA ribosomal C-terminal domain-containing protein [Oscillospiraceae bacterium]